MKIGAGMTNDGLFRLFTRPSIYELWAKSQEGLRTLQGLISYIEKSGV